MYKYYFLVSNLKLFSSLILFVQLYNPCFQKTYKYKMNNMINYKTKFKKSFYRSSSNKKKVFYFEKE